ncbi:uncharacterized protein LOC131285502 [Anopheles ziemanni]|uniref:uncharacterized protein LOC131285502 n=1 Tax=Anopheles ziemanni TaxID=345580 RepID=UPI0026605205|nr:uncharacterized protein LOC131285502 [Anopheles ziemanni]
MASAYDTSHVGPPKIIESVEESRERIALKYPRKKIDSELFKRPDAPHKRPSSPLFLRRHEILPPKQTAATYAEHKRQMHAKRIWESRTEVAVVPSPLDPRIEFYKRTHDKTAPRNEETPFQPLTKHGPQNNETQNIQGNQDNTNQENVQCNGKSIVEICTSNEISESLEPPATLTTGVGNTVKNVFGKVPGKVIGVNGATKHTSTTAASNVMVEVPSATSKGRQSRELHLLLSDATDFLEKSTRREQSNKADQQHKVASNVLEKFGITRDVRVVLDKYDLEGAGTALRPKLRRRNSICFGTLTSSSECNFGNLDKPSKLSNNTSKKNTITHSKALEGAKPASKAGKKKSEIVVNNEVVKPLSEGDKKPSEIVANDKRPLNHGATTSKQQCKSGAKPGNSKANGKRKIQAKQDPVPKKQRRETLNCSDKSVLNETEKQSTTVQLPESVSIEEPVPSKFMKNNSPKIHCNSKYITSCCLCNYQVEHQIDMVKHYVYEHPASEAFVSRVTPECAKTIKQNPFNVVGKRVVSRHGPKTISFSCFFCEKRNTLRGNDWVHHLVSHTGEYRFRCRACPAMARTLDEQVQHDDICGDPEMIVCNDITFDENHVYGYMCEMCNFVQIRRFNMDRHLQREHHTEETSCFKFSLVNYELDSESQSFHGLVKCEPKAEENWLCNSSIIVKEEKIPNEAEELESLESVSKQIDYPICIEKQELILPDDCDDSNDSQCTLPMTSNDEDSWNILDLEENQSCDQQKQLSVVKKENVGTEQCNVLNSEAENGQTLVENVCDNVYESSPL